MTNPPTDTCPGCDRVYAFDAENDHYPLCRAVDAETEQDNITGISLHICPACSSVISVSICDMNGETFFVPSTEPL